MAERGFLSDMMAPFMKRRGTPSDKALERLCEELLGDRGEVSGLVTALEVLDGFEAMGPAQQLDFFRLAADRFGVDQDATEEAIAKWTKGDDDAARALHFLTEARSQELIRRLNLPPGATSRLVAMRAELLKSVHHNPELSGLDRDFRHLFSSWFNRGFLEIRRIDWSTPALVLEKIIEYEAVHEITGWDDLRQRVADPDRRLFAFFHPAMPDDPLIFVEVALTRAIPNAIGPILGRTREVTDPADATTAVFYSISNCQKGLRGISFGNFLIKQVVIELQRELSHLKTFVTLSPVPGLRRWATSATEDEPLLSDDDRATIAALKNGDRPAPDHLARLTARYLARAKRGKGTVYDPVAHFHLGNGAQLHAVHTEADLSDAGQANSWGAMVNYLYDGGRIERNHQAYVTAHTVAMSSAVRSLAKG